MITSGKFVESRKAWESSALMERGPVIAINKSRSKRMGKADKDFTYTKLLGG
jgi:hypothetical protein